MRIFILILISFMALPVAAHAESQDAAPAITSTAPPVSDQTTAIPAVAEEDYYCPMHTEVHGKKGDKCRICHMPLEPVPAEKVETPPPAVEGEKHE